MSRIIIENLSMTGILNWLTEEYKVKKSGQPFKIEDIQGYIKRKQIPSYYGGGYEIKKMDNKFNKLYKLVQ